MAPRPSGAGVGRGDRSFGLFPYKFPLQCSPHLRRRLRRTRSGHVHQGQDILAKCGKRIVAARGGRIQYRGYQASGAGYYLVVDGKGTGHDYVYMHLRPHGLPKRGQRVRTGEPIGTVGETGDASGCHLHFEMWTKPGWYEGGQAMPSVTRHLKALGSRGASGRCRIDSPRANRGALSRRRAPAPAITRASTSRPRDPSGGRGVWIRHTVHKRPGEEPDGGDLVHPVRRRRARPAGDQGELRRRRALGARRRLHPDRRRRARARAGPPGEIETPELAGELGPAASTTRASRSTTSRTSASTTRRCRGPSS